MTKTTKLTFRDFLRPIPPPTNLSNVASSPATIPCATCQTLLPDRTSVSNNKIRTSYTRHDTFPDFPALSATASRGCGFCALLRSTVTSTWGTCATQNFGVDVSEEDALIESHLEREWDGQVVFTNARFSFKPFSSEQGAHKMFYYETRGSQEQGDGNVLGLKVDVLLFGPAKDSEENDEEFEEDPEFRKTFTFDVFDSIGG
ncbi:hypothetical protein jhhlp_007841 [Lomentospora prolificans]|uniref:Uncharacterized protein n=1 Tax=Lomentospora prolificans TaxID=41688 RepID=A0A2N3N0P7_9PEZI|nr:hypothetical protein jhhlp_007841 [Lomentospora prolificans]